MKKAIYWLICLGMMFACGVAMGADDQNGWSQADKDRFWECVFDKKDQIDALPEKEFIIGLNGERIDLGLYAQYAKINPLAFLPAKFYYWENEVRDVVLSNSKKIRARVYWNYSAACDGPRGLNSKKNPKAICGDFAEIYDKNNAFIGFMVFVGIPPQINPREVENGAGYIVLLNPDYKKIE